MKNKYIESIVLNRKLEKKIQHIQMHDIDVQKITLGIIFKTAIKTRNFNDR